MLRVRARRYCTMAGCFQYGGAENSFERLPAVIRAALASSFTSCCGAAVIRLFSKPNNSALAVLEDVLYQTYLCTSFFDICLVDANGIYP